MRGDTVVYVHGLWLPGDEAFLLQQRIVAAQGFRWFSFDYSPVWQHTAEVTQALADFIRELAVPRVHLIGHSLGGLVILRTLEQYPDLPPGRVVFLGTPALASAAARNLGRFSVGRALMGRMVAEELLRDHERCWVGGRELGIIAGTQSFSAWQLVGDFDEENDGTVAVAETRLPGAKAHLSLAVSHTGMLFSAQVAREVGSFLENGHFES